MSGGTLASVAVIAPDDAWVVGNNGGYYGSARTFTSHWDGSYWSPVPSPNQSQGEDWLEAVAAGSNNDVWAVGAAHNQMAILHWDGTAWHVVSPPPLDAKRSWLYGITVAAPNDVWAVGSFSTNTMKQSLIIHWDGLRWRIVPSSISPAKANELSAVTALNPNNVWAAGSAENNALVLHWNGTSWSTALDGTREGFVPMGLRDISVARPNDVWAVGTLYKSGTGIKTNGDSFTYYYTGAAAVHWDGRRWIEVGTPAVNATHYLRSVAARAPNDVWAVGEILSGDRHTLAFHWDGNVWQKVTSPALMEENGFTHIAATAQGVWAVGRSDEHEDGPMYGLTAQFSGCKKP